MEVAGFTSDLAKKPSPWITFNTSYSTFKDLNFFKYKYKYKYIRFGKEFFECITACLTELCCTQCSWVGSQLCSVVQLRGIIVQTITNIDHSQGSRPPDYEVVRLVVSFFSFWSVNIIGMIIGLIIFSWTLQKLQARKKPNKSLACRLSPTPSPSSPWSPSSPSSPSSLSPSPSPSSLSPAGEWGSLDISIRPPESVLSSSFHYHTMTLAATLQHFTWKEVHIF